VDSVAFSTDGKRILGGGSNGNIVAWDTNSGQFLRALTGHKGGVRALAFSPDGSRLASGSEDKTIGVWSAN
jgi:WD40 repeat protein